MPPLRAVSVDIHNPTPFLLPILFSTLESASEWVQENRGLGGKGVDLFVQIVDVVREFPSAILFTINIDILPVSHGRLTPIPG